LEILKSDMVWVRRRRWRVVDIRGYERCQVLTLVGVEPANSGLVCRFVTPFDVIERIARRSYLTRISRRLWRRACRAVIGADTPPGALACARAAGIDLLPHQLEPALAVVRGLGSRVLLADDVGLGKTIQAGLIVSELRALGAVDHVLVITPAGLRDQWARELSDRFNIDAAILDVRTLRHSIAALPIGVNPWQTVPVAIASIDYIKRTEVLAAAAACRWDAVIVDEAHGVAGDSDRHAAVTALAKRSAYVILLTATPHSGDRATFASLCGIGATPGDTLLTFRRSRQDLKFATNRRIHRLHVRMSRDEENMHALLAAFSRAIHQQYERTRPTQDYWLALSVLHKRAFSSARSLQHSIDRRLATLQIEEATSASQLNLPIGDLASELTSADEEPDWPPLLTLEDAAHERDLLGALAEAAGRAARHETKIAALARLLRRVKEPAIVFTEYRDTLWHVQASLGASSVTLHGGLTREERASVLNQFTSGRSDLLLATDAAGEGLNLQQTCRLVVNLEMPWNPMRLEQRIGRVDRIGQRRAVHIFHLIAHGSGEAHLLSRLQWRVSRARADIGGADPLGIPPDDRPEDIVSHLCGPFSGKPIRPGPESTGPDLRCSAPSLEREGQAEADRIGWARTFVTRGGDETIARIEGLGPCVTRTRRWGTRAALRGRTLMLWQVVARDGSGRPVASTFVTVAVEPCHRHDDEKVRQRVEEAASAWRDRVATNHRAFIGTRLLRERAMAVERVLLQGAGSAELFQPGLFERRDERAHMVVVDAQAAAEREEVERLARIERAGALSFLAPNLLLALTS
jgi:superfamily II DNA or RNA helicase